MIERVFTRTDSKPEDSKSEKWDKVLCFSCREQDNVKRRLFKRATTGNAILKSNQIWIVIQFWIDYGSIRHMLANPRNKML